MKQSAIVEEWKAEGCAEGWAEGYMEGLRQTLVDLLEHRFSAPIAADLLGSIQAECDRDKLLLWVIPAVEASSLEEFRATSGL